MPWNLRPFLVILFAAIHLPQITLANEPAQKAPAPHVVRDVPYLNQGFTVVSKGKSFHVVTTKFPSGKLRSRTVTGPGYSEIKLDRNGDGVIDYWEIKNGATTVTSTEPDAGRFLKVVVEQRKKLGILKREFTLSYDKKKYVAISRSYEPYRKQFSDDPTGESQYYRTCKAAPTELTQFVTDMKDLINSSVDVKGRDTALSCAAASMTSSFFGASCMSPPFGPKDLTAMQQGLAKVLQAAVEPPAVDAKHLTFFQCLDNMGMDVITLKIQRDLDNKFNNARTQLRQKTKFPDKVKTEAEQNAYLDKAMVGVCGDPSKDTNPPVFPRLQPDAQKQAIARLEKRKLSKAEVDAIFKPQQNPKTFKCSQQAGDEIGSYDQNNDQITLFRTADNIATLRPGFNASSMYASTIFHELLHGAGLDDNNVPDIEKCCAPNDQGLVDPNNCTELAKAGERRLNEEYVDIVLKKSLPSYDALRNVLVDGLKTPAESDMFYDHYIQALNGEHAEAINSLLNCRKAQCSSQPCDKCDSVYISHLKELSDQYFTSECAEFFIFLDKIQSSEANSICDEKHRQVQEKLAKLGPLISLPTDIDKTFGAKETTRVPNASAFTQSGSQVVAGQPDIKPTQAVVDQKVAAQLPTADQPVPYVAPFKFSPDPSPYKLTSMDQPDPFSGIQLQTAQVTPPGFRINPSSDALVGPLDLSSPNAVENSINFNVPTQQFSTTPTQDPLASFHFGGEAEQQSFSPISQGQGLSLSAPVIADQSAPPPNPFLRVPLGPAPESAPPAAPAPPMSFTFQPPAPVSTSAPTTASAPTFIPDQASPINPTTAPPTYAAAQAPTDYSAQPIAGSLGAPRAGDITPYAIEDTPQKYVNTFAAALSTGIVSVAQAAPAAFTGANMAVTRQLPGIAPATTGESPTSGARQPSSVSPGASSADAGVAPVGQPSLIHKPSGLVTPPLDLDAPEPPSSVVGSSISKQTDGSSSPTSGSFVPSPHAPDEPSKIVAKPLSDSPKAGLSLPEPVNESSAPKKQSDSTAGPSTTGHSATETRSTASTTESSAQVIIVRSQARGQYRLIEPLLKSNGDLGPGVVVIDNKGQAHGNTKAKHVTYMYCKSTESLLPLGQCP